MEDPKTLRVGDRIRFVSLPDEWTRPQATVDADDVSFLRTLIERKRPSRVSFIDEFGTPWIEARIRLADGRIEYHTWAVIEKTGWRKVVPRG